MRLLLPELPLSRDRRELLLNRTAQLPGHKLTVRDIEKGGFLIAGEGSLAVYWCPTDLPPRVNREALVMLVGLTPGFQQARIAYETVRNANWANPGLTYGRACRLANRAAAFEGMRRRIWTWLDALHVDEYLGVDSCESLFGEYEDLLAVTSAVRYPVFIDGKNYGGRKGGLLTEHRVLVPFIERLLAADIRRVPNALVVPLGKAVESALEKLVCERRVDREQVLFGFPHPSGVNSWKAGQWKKSRPQMQREVDRWFG